ncbi:hypothetical protein [Mycolicibacterium frederiksbergense]|uniref:Uncharacterized protein n=1 Tax=Mycolicibacterium frederiksbergense TaxID=117567 RepID=A0A6H0S0C6_9MYCO|nr:hypothetical protein [Mycolicibacterium frederiksbergense]QIV79497.1 hypothetical protein EXE63_00130 [Mycolicibacterium frederiksbergense]
MDDVEKTQDVTDNAPHDVDPDKTTVVPSTPRPSTAGAQYGDDAERTQIVRDTPAPSRPAPTTERQYPPAAAGGQQPPLATPHQHPGTGAPPQRPQTPPPAQYGPVPGTAPQQGPPPSYGPPPMSGPTNYGPPPAPGPHYGPGPQPPHGYPPQHDPYAQPDPYGYSDPYAQQPPQAGPFPGQPAGQPPGPQPGQVQSPLQAANSALAKGGSFIARLIQRGMYGELIKNPWFQQTRQQSPDQFVYIGFGIGVVLALILGQIGGLIGDLLTLAMWAGLAYTFFAVGTKKAVQFVAYGICGIGAVLYGGGALLGFLAWSQLTSSPYMSGLGGSSIGTVILLQSITSTVFAVLLGWAGITVHRTIKKLSGHG